jgi:cytidine deaminase
MFGTVVVQANQQNNNKETYRCLHCGGTRQFILQGVKEHLKAKHVSALQGFPSITLTDFLRHKISDAVMGRDMREI